MPRKLVTSDQAKPCAKQPTAPCSDCPWTRQSLPGWLGPYNPMQWLRIVRDFWHTIPCHTLRRRPGVSHQHDMELDGHWECAGAAIFRANIGAKPFEGRGVLQLPADSKAVFASEEEFLRHHESEGPLL